MKNQKEIVLNKTLIITVMLMMLTASSPADIDQKPLLRFQSQVDAYDKIVYERTFDYSDTLQWWKIADELMISIHRDLRDGESVSEKRIDIDPEKRGYLTYSIYSSRVGEAKIGVTYFAARPLPDARNEFGVYSVPLNSSNTVFLLFYERLWYSQFIRTFHIMELNRKTGKFEITGRLEESNFFKKVALTGELRYWPSWQEADVIPPYLVSGGSLVTGSIKEEGKAIKFDTHWGRCRPGGGPCYDDMIISWVYANKTLRATHYVDSYQSDWNEAKQIYEHKVERVELAP